MRGKLFALSILMLFVAGCAAPLDHGHDAGPAVDVTAEAEAIKARSAEWLGLAQAKDTAGTAAIHLENATTIFDGEVHQGRAAIQANADSNIAANPDSTINWTTTHVEVAASGDLGYERGSWTYDPDGDGEAAAENGEYLTVWKKVDGAWYCAVDAGTTIKAEEEAADAG